MQGEERPQQYCAADEVKAEDLWVERWQTNGLQGEASVETKPGAGVFKM